MTQAIVARGSTSVAFELYQDGGGNLAVAIDIGKPDQKWHEVSTDTPKVRDDWSSVETITVLGQFLGSDAYGRANMLIEDLVKPHSNGTPLTLDLTAVPGIETIVDIGVPQENSVELDYQPGVANRVDLQMTVPVVQETLG